MSADEMFEELGYRKLQVIGLQECAYSNGKGKEIIFNKMKSFGLYGRYQWLSLEELQAINEKVKELRLGEQLNKEIKSIKEK